MKVEKKKQCVFVSDQCVLFVSLTKYFKGIDRLEGGRNYSRESTRKEDIDNELSPSQKLCLLPTQGNGVRVLETSRPACTNRGPGALYRYLPLTML